MLKSVLASLDWSIQDREVKSEKQLSLHVSAQIQTPATAPPAFSSLVVLSLCV